MSGLAEVMINSGYQVSGSDLQESTALMRLRKLGAQVSVGHHPDAVVGADAVVLSSAVGPGNSELRRARQIGLPVVPRVTMLGELLRARTGIAVAGSHGKTTITSMIAAVLHEAGLDPTYVVGGIVRQFDASAGLGKGEYIVVESDESDGSFLHLQPVIAVASNIDADHMETYDYDLRRLKRAFVDFFENLPFYGLAVLCFEDENLREVATMISKSVICYGIDQPSCDFSATNLRLDGTGSVFDLHAPTGLRECRLSSIGRHNVLNSLAALAVAYELKVPDEAADRALANFAGVARRLELHGWIEFGGARIELVDDYGHHPTEISASLAALAEGRAGRRLVLVFQPHRYSRTSHLFDALADALGTADVLVLTEVYAAGEQPDQAPAGRDLANAVRLRGHKDTIFVADLADVPASLANLVKDGDLVITMGAGSIASLAATLCEQAK